MALTLTDAQNELRSLLNEPTAVFWTDGELETWIKEGVRMIASKTHAVEAEDDLTLVSSQLIYTASDHSWIGDMLSPYAAIYNAGSGKYKGLEFIHPKQIGNSLTYTPGAPRYYTFHNRSIYVWPLPTTSTAGKTVSILYATETEDITALKDEHQHLAIQWGQIRAMEKDMKWQAAAAQKQQFYSELNFEKTDKSMRDAEGIRSVKAGKSHG